MTPASKGGLLEKDVRDPCIRFATDKARVFHKRMHFGPGSARGWPDDLFILPYNHHWWVEFKRPGGKATDLQLITHNRMRMYGCDVTVIDDRVEFQRELVRRIHVIEEVPSHRVPASVFE